MSERTTNVHIHDLDPTCREHVIDGRLVGECQLQSRPAAVSAPAGEAKCEHCGKAMESDFADLCSECAAKNNQRIADYAAGLRCLMCGHALNATDAPAAVSAPASEPTDDLYIACEVCEGSGAVFDDDGEEDSCPNGCRILYVTPAPRSPAPASGAPDEDVVRKVMSFLIDYGHHSAAEVSAGEYGGNGDVKAAKREQRATRKAAEEYVRSIATRLAAAERAGEILDDYADAPCLNALLGEDADACTCITCGVRAARAALTPTAPSPEEER